MEKKITCTVCPRGCTILAIREGEELKLTGAACPRGEAYAREEFTDPKRMFTSTVRVAEGLSEITLLPVKSAGPVPKRILFDLAELCREVVVTEKIKRGDVVVRNALGCGVDLVAGANL
ncbi:MAG: DUF1667 domain-containing protein [Clostridia bacterium]|nr:DUF1667 domain-containing protein [Clostridia bacterium]